MLDEAIYLAAEADQPLTVRSVFYRVMSTGIIEKSEKSYRVVQRRVLFLRRAGVLPYAWIADGTRWMVRGRSWNNLDAAVDDLSASYRRALWNDQSVHVEVWSEKDALASVISQVKREWDVPLLVARGFSSETFLYNTAQAIIRSRKPAVIYQLGDHDPSGVVAWQHTKAKLREFAPDTDFTFERLAVTPQQIIDYDLQTRPTKATDSRAASFVGESVEVDALPSPVLRGLVRDGIERHIDRDVLRLTRMVEREERAALESMFTGLDDGGVR